MRIASFNINGIGARLPRLLDWLDACTPDVVCLQEIKCVTDNFPVDPIREAGYRALVHGQKGFNGVAILSREPAELVLQGLPGDATDEQARYLEADVNGVRIACLYLPNGNPVPGPKFDYKLNWMERLALRSSELLQTERPVVLAGDYNVCPTDDDVFSMRAMADDALVQPESRATFRRIVHQGWLDAIRATHSGDRVYTYWDYQAGAWDRDHGLRIDHLLLSPQAADRLITTGIDREVRGKDRPSDHVPVWCDLEV